MSVSLTLPSCGPSIAYWLCVHGPLLSGLSATLVECCVCKHSFWECIYRLPKYNLDYDCVCVMFHYRVSQMGVAHELFLPIVLHAAKQ